jgi:hypothetical protein
MRIRKVHSRTESDLVVIVAVLVSHWSQSLETMATALDRSSSRSFARATYHLLLAATPLWVHLLAHKNLFNLEHLYYIYKPLQHSALRDLQQDDANMMWLLPSYQYVLNLQSENVRRT